MNRLGWLAWLGLGACLGLSAQGWEAGASPVPVTAQARQSEFSQGILTQWPVERLKAQTVKDPSGVRISVRQVRSGQGEDQLWELRWEPGAEWGSGTWVAFRDGLGQLREVRILLLEASDGSGALVAQPGTWVRLVPQGAGRGCRLDVFLAGRLVTGGWTLAGTLADAMGSHDSWLWDVTSQDIDWGALLPGHRWEDEKVEALRARMHKALSTMPTSPPTLWWPDPRSSSTGTAANGSPWGSWMLIPGLEGPATRGLGPWGVSLWAATGVVRGWKAPFFEMKDLLEPRVELPGYSRALVPDNLAADPAFALDWVRNLGLGVHKALYPSRPRTNESADVTGLPYLEPLPVAGYSVEDVPALVHLLAVTRPGQIYLASLSTQQVVEKGKASSVTFREPAVLLPWVGSDHKVRAVVYAGPQELTLAQWLAQVPPRKGVRPDHIALVGLPLPPSVDLPVLPAR